jgi:predicted RNA-binding Zn-ribbon protein involved in translation (DUF1610 family)
LGNEIAVMPMPHYCFECGGTLTYDPALKNFACKSCGATYTYEELLERKERLYGEEGDQKRRRQRDYLQWWLSKK